MVLTVAPPLVIEDAQLGYYFESIAQLVDLMHSPSVWTEALQMAARVISSI